MSSSDLSDCSIVLSPPPPPLPNQQSENKYEKMFTTRVTPGNVCSDGSNRFKLIEDACNQSWKLFFGGPRHDASDNDERARITIISLYHHCDSVIQSGPTYINK